jgi:hypothetical protein
LYFFYIFLFPPVPTRYGVNIVGGVGKVKHLFFDFSGVVGESTPKPRYSSPGDAEISFDSLALGAVVVAA